MTFLLLSMVALSVLSSEVSATIQGRSALNCTMTYQAVLQQAERVREECSIFNYYDCCQPIVMAKAVFPSNRPLSGRYVITDPCERGTGKLNDTTYAYCDMVTDEGGWILIQRRRYYNSLDFARNWLQYEEGFGDVNGEFWFGLQKIHCLTTRYDVELRIDLSPRSGAGITWVYQLFRVASSLDNYRLHIGQGVGPGRDQMMVHNGMQFSTYDEDHDVASWNCAQVNQGGWWYRDCYGANLNGHRNHLYWGSLPHTRVNYPNVVMMVRPKSCPTSQQC